MALTPDITPRWSPLLKADNTGLGNALFQIASTYGIAKTLGRPISFHNVDSYGDILQRRFGCNHKNTILRNVCAPVVTDHFNTLQEGPGMNQTYNSDLIQRISSRSENIQIYGYLESKQYFKSCANEIYNLFTPDDNSLKHLSDAYPILFSGENTISVHYRCNDSIAYYNHTYYKAAVEYIRAHISNPVFLVFTDNETQIDPESIGLDSYILVKNKYDYLDLWAMSLCKHNITSHSTFAFWGSFLNANPDKQVLYQKSRTVDWYEGCVAI